jgi:anti-sigma factor RsiW
MDKFFQDRSGEEREHPAREMLMLFVDGELTAKDSAQLELHLEACWPCRVKTKNIQEAIADIIEFDETVLTPRLLPPDDWRNFDRQLRQLAAQSGSRSLVSRLFASLGRFLPVTRLVATPGGFLQPLARVVAAALAVILMAALVLRLNRESTVSAGELLHRAAAAQAAKLSATTQPVIHQRLEVRRKDQGREQSANWEIWNDTVNDRFREFCEHCGFESRGDSKTPATQHPTPDTLLNELNAVLVANHMDPRRPLAAASYQAWHNTLQRQQDEVARTKLTGDVDALTLRTVSAPPLSAGQIVEAVFVVRAQDWQPVQLRLTVEAGGGNRVYDLVETVSEVVSLTQVDPAIFAEPTAANPNSAIAETRNSELETPNAKSETTGVSPVTATSELEVEALRLLNQAGADLGEQISVKRMSDGMLQITGMVETDKRKAEIVNALGPIAGNPAVRIEVQTVAEAVAAQRHTKPTPLPSQRAIQIAGNTMAAEPELRTYFEGNAKDTDEAIRQYAARMVSLSNRGMDHLWAMKRLLSQFSPEELRALTPDARTKWLSLIRAHAHSYQQANESLRRELQPVFFPSQSSAAVSSEGAIADIVELSRAIEQLFAQGSANDRVIRSAFTSSSNGAMTTVIKAPQFWQSLNNAEALADRIGRAQ